MGIFWRSRYLATLIRHNQVFLHQLPTLPLTTMIIVLIGPEKRPYIGIMGSLPQSWCLLVEGTRKLYHTILQTYSTITYDTIPYYTIPELGDLFFWLLPGLWDQGTRASGGRTTWRRAPRPSQADPAWEAQKPLTTQRLQSSSFLVMGYFLLRDSNIQPRKGITLEPLGKGYLQQPNHDFCTSAL